MGRAWERRKRREGRSKEPLGRPDVDGKITLK
jgi:hypothetical protein